MIELHYHALKVTYFMSGQDLVMNYQTVQTLPAIRSDVQALYFAFIHSHSPLQVTGDIIHDLIHKIQV